MATVPNYLSLTFSAAIVLTAPFGAATAREADEASRQISRLEAKYTGNREMTYKLGKLQETFLNYQKNQCYFEKAATDGGVVLKNPSIAAGRAYVACMKRTSAQISESLSKL